MPKHVVFPRFLLLCGAVLSFLSCALLVSGCGTLRNATAFNQRLMVKVRSGYTPDEIAPDKLLVKKYPQDAWHFRRIADAPEDPNQRGIWYVAWRETDVSAEKKPLSPLALFWSRWKKVHEFAPSLARATHSTFGVYPLMIEPNLVFHANPPPPLDLPAMGEAPPEADNFTSGPIPDFLQAQDPGAPPAAPPTKNDILVALAPEKRRGIKSDYVPFYWPPKTASRSTHGQPTDIAALRISRSVTDAWPVPVLKLGNGKRAPDIFWYQGPGYTQLAEARGKVMPNPEGVSQIRIGILDTGYDSDIKGIPLYVYDSPRSDADGWTHGWKKDLLRPSGWARKRVDNLAASHGAATMGILGGRRIRVTEGAPDSSPVIAEGWLGGAPLAQIYPVRVAPDVVSLGTAALAYGIDYASRVNKCDVISMSHGGLPTQTWVDAINAAYERGTAMFAAEGDFFSLVPYGGRPDGVIVPSSAVYPAAFGRVVGVTGATSDGRTYAGNALERLLTRLHLIGSWGFRGSYGPDGWLAGSIDSSRRATDKKNPQPSGSHRVYPIAGASPNIPWVFSYSLKDAKNEDRQKQEAEKKKWHLFAPKYRPTYYPASLDLDGAGTSAATPQVAAAAALWLEKNRDKIGRNDWRTWKKAEAVYLALLSTASRANDRRPDMYLGVGLVKAGDALELDYAGVQKIQNDRFRFREMESDRFDGSQSLWRQIFRVPARRNQERLADLDQRAHPEYDRKMQLARMYYNTLLLQKWHGGAFPRHARGARPADEKSVPLNPELWNKALRLADKNFAAASP